MTIEADVYFQNSSFNSLKKERKTYLYDFSSFLVGRKCRWEEIVGILIFFYILFL